MSYTLPTGVGGVIWHKMSSNTTSIMSCFPHLNFACAGAIKETSTSLSCRCFNYLPDIPLVSIHGDNEVTFSKMHHHGFVVGDLAMSGMNSGTFFGDVVTSVVVASSVEVVSLAMVMLSEVLLCREHVAVILPAQEGANLSSKSERCEFTRVAGFLWVEHVCAAHVDLQR